MQDSVPWWGRSLEKEMAAHSSTLAWKIQWTEEHGGLHSLTAKQKQSSWSRKARERLFQAEESRQLHGGTAAHSVIG